MSSKSNQYTLDGFEDSSAICSPHGAKLCCWCIRKMLVCRVALGKQFEATEPMPGIWQAPNNCHSVVAYPEAGFLTYPEFVVYNAHQVDTTFISLVFPFLTLFVSLQAYPGYLVEYKIKTSRNYR